MSDVDKCIHGLFRCTECWPTADIRHQHDYLIPPADIRRQYDYLIPLIEFEMEVLSQRGLIPKTGVDRAVANSPPPCADVGDDVTFMIDEGMGMMKGDETYAEDVNPHVVAANRRGVEALLAERHKTHGSFAANARHGQALREMFRASSGWKVATDRQREALDYVAGKLARILSGQPGYADHWDDIAGYAKLACNPDPQR